MSKMYLVWGLVSVWIIFYIGVVAAVDISDGIKFGIDYGFELGSCNILFMVWMMEFLCLFIDE